MTCRAFHCRHTVWYIADHMESCKLFGSSERLQVEFDSMFTKAVTMLLCANKYVGPSIVLL